MSTRQEKLNIFKYYKKFRANFLNLYKLYKKCRPCKARQVTKQYIKMAESSLICVSSEKYHKTGK